jgi:precorrin-3B synthase
VLRPWPAEDGGLVRLRLIGGRLTLDQLTALAEVSTRYADGAIHLTGRANLQLRGLPLTDGALEAEVVDALIGTGLVPHPTHELVRNVMVSPLSGIGGGVADLRPLATAYDEQLCADARLAGLPGRFLVVLDDGRGDLQGRTLDLGAMAVDDEHVQLRAGGNGWGEVVPIAEAPSRLIALAHAFLDQRGDGESAAWHVDELASPLLDGSRDQGTLRNAGPLPYGPFDGGEHVAVPGGVLTAEQIAELNGPLVVTPWNGIVRTA